MVKSKSRTQLVDEALEIIRSEIGYVNNIYAIIKTLSNQDINLSELKRELKPVAKLESRIKVLAQAIFSIADSLSNSSSSKVLLMDSSRLLDIRLKLNNLIKKLESKLYINFFGSIKGDLINNISDKDEQFENTLSLISLVLKNLIYLKDIFLEIDNVLDNKKLLSEGGDVFDPNYQKPSINYSTFYHATGNPNFFSLNPIILQNKDFYLAGSVYDARQHAAGFSGFSPSSLYVVRVKIPVSMVESYVESVSGDSYTDASMDFFCIPQKNIKQVNGLIRSGNILIDVLN